MRPETRDSLDQVVMWKRESDWALNNQKIHTLSFMRAARAERLSWARIGQSLGITATAARRYFARNGGGR